MTSGVEIALQVLEKQLNRPLETALEVCARCGICAEACHYYVAEPAPEHTPAARGEALRAAYRAEHDFLSRIFPRWTGAKKLDEATLATLAATAAGAAPESLVMLADAAIEKGKDPSFFRDLFLEQMTALEKELQAKVGDAGARLTVQRAGARVLYGPLAGVHTILPPAIIFHVAREDWTLSIFEAANYGVFLGDTARAKEIARRIVDEAKQLGVREVVLAECGHAYAALRWEAPNWFGETFPFRIVSLVEKIDEYLAEGRLHLDPSSNPDRITYHDSCNMARTGGVIEEPRRVLRARVQNLGEKTANRQEAYCCGGGGGLVALPEYQEIRLRAGGPKARQIHETGARMVVAACENCRLQIGELSHEYNLGIEVSAVADLVVRALRLPPTRHA